MPLPVLTPRLRLKVYHVRMPAPRMSYVSDAGQVVKAYMPPADRMAFYGGLGLAAVVGVLDWPVAAAIGIGTVFARRASRRSGMPGRAQPAG